MTTITLSSATRTVSLAKASTILGRALAPKPVRLTQARVKAELRTVGVTFKKTEWEEFRVNIAGGEEVTAYYTNDLEDALLTGRAMAAIEEKSREKIREKLAAATRGKPEPTTYTLSSVAMCYTPGVVEYARQAYKFKRDRKTAIAMLTDGYKLPEHVAIAILEGQGVIDRAAETVTITI